MSIVQKRAETATFYHGDALKIEECRTQYDIFRYMRSASGYFGYEYFTIADISSTKGKTLEQIMRLTNWPREMIHEYDAGRLLDHSPMVEWAMAHATPWVYDVAKLDGPNVTTRSARGAKLFTAFHMTRGTYQPVHNPAFGSMALGMQGRRPGLSEDMLREFSWIAQFVCARMAEIDRIVPPPQIQLTDRERECLNWTAAGKTSSDIGTIIGLSTHTVDHHLNSAAQKLNASNRAHAVATAIRLKIIS